MVPAVFTVMLLDIATAADAVLIVPVPPMTIRVVPEMAVVAVREPMQVIWLPFQTPAPVSWVTVPVTVQLSPHAIVAATDIVNAPGNVRVPDVSVAAALTLSVPVPVRV